MIIVNLFVGCAVNTVQNIEPTTKKDRFRSTLFYIATDQELRILDKTKTEKQLNEFWAQFWALRDSDPVTLENEFMDTYLERWQHANEQFGGHKSGKSGGHKC